MMIWEKLNYISFKKKIAKIRKSRDAKTLMENFVSLSLLQVAGYIFPILTYPYLARVIGVDKFGEIAFASSVMIYFQTVVNWGFDFLGARDVAKNREDLHKISQIFSDIFWTRIFLMTVSFIILLLLIFLIPQFNEMSALLIVTFSLILGHILFPQWLFQGLERMKYITVLNLLTKLLFTIAVFLFIKEKKDFILQPLFVSLGTLLSGFIAMYLITCKWRIKLYPPSYAAIKNALAQGFDLFLNNLIPTFYNNFSMLLLGFLHGNVATGIYSVGTKFYTVAYQLMTIITRTFFPYLSRKIEKHSMYVKFNLLTALSISILLFLFAPIIIRLFFTPEFYDAILILRIASVSLFFITLSNAYGASYLIIEGYEKKLRNITLLSSVIGCSLSLPLVFYFKAIGAVLTVTISRAILGSLTMWQAVKIKKNAKKNAVNAP